MQAPSPTAPRGARVAMRMREAYRGRMQKWMVAVLLGLAVAGPVAAQEGDLAAAPRIAIAEFKPLYVAQQVLVIDVRDAASFQAGHIPGARSIPLAQLLEPASVAELKAAKKPIVLYCA